MEPEKTIKIAVTGAYGFIGSHVSEILSRSGYDVVRIGKEQFQESLKEAIANCDAIVHLAGMNRGPEQSVYETNIDLAKKLIAAIGTRKPHIIFSSSTQQRLDNPYGRSKQAAADLLKQWATQNGGSCTTLIIPNVFGDRCKPFYNSVVATFCHQLLNGETPTILEDKEIELVHVNTVAFHILRLLQQPPKTGEETIIGEKKIRVSKLLQTLQQFMELRKKQVIPDITDPFVRNLYTTLDSYATGSDRVHNPELKTDNRGWLFEAIKMEHAGQIFLSVTKPGVTRGQHFHFGKLEKFCVIQGEAIIRLEHPDTKEIIEYRVTGPSCVDIPVFHPHNIENVGQIDLLTLFWSSDIFDPTNPDTHPKTVGK